MTTTEDYQKYFCAMGSRSIRRVAAKVYAATGLDAEERGAMMMELTEALNWHRTAVVVGTAVTSELEDLDGQDDQVIEVNTAVYSDGRPVFTAVDWIDGYATIVHHPDSLQRQTEDPGELAEEICPCCGGMPSTEPGPDDDADHDAPKTK
jgi:hypothetical protein